MAIPATQAATCFKPGQVANPKGRPKGVRNKLSTEFLNDLREVWQKRGMQALEHVAVNDPAKLVSAMVQVLPKDFQLTVTDEASSYVINALPALSSEEWAAQVAAEQAPEAIEHATNGNGKGKQVNSDTAPVSQSDSLPPIPADPYDSE
jgi:hypothetical protein